MVVILMTLESSHICESPYFFNVSIEGITQVILSIIVPITPRLAY
jgi:hypothetical protein